MMTLQKISITIALLLGFAALAPVAALAQVNIPTPTLYDAAGSASSSVKFTTLETRAKDRGDTEIDRRVGALNELSTRIGNMQRISDAFKQSLNSAVGAELSTLSALKTKIEGDTDSATLKSDVQSITDSYRIFALVLPQVRIVAAADRIATIFTMMGTLGSKLQARIQAAEQAGADVTALNAALGDMSTKLNDAQTQAQAAISVSAPLQPDNGDKTVMASNTAALKEARTDISTAQKDLVAARKDVDTIVKGLRSANVSASSTTQTTTQ